MSGVNKVIILGRLGAKPEIKNFDSTSVCNFTVATSEKWIKDGENQEKTEWHRISVWGKLGQICEKYLEKGRQVYIEGKLETRSWEDQQGQKKYATEIIADRVEFIGGGEKKTESSLGEESLPF